MLPKKRLKKPRFRICKLLFTRLLFERCAAFFQSKFDLSKMPQKRQLFSYFENPGKSNLTFLWFLATFLTAKSVFCFFVDFAQVLAFFFYTRFFQKQIVFHQIRPVFGKTRSPKAKKAMAVRTKRTATAAAVQARHNQKPLFIWLLCRKRRIRQRRKTPPSARESPSPAGGRIPP